MGFTLHYGGSGLTFPVAETVMAGATDDDPISYAVADLMADVRACVARGGDWHPLPLEGGGSVDVWFGPGVPMFISDDEVGGWTPGGRQDRPKSVSTALAVIARHRRSIPD